MILKNIYYIVLCILKTSYGTFSCTFCKFMSSNLVSSSANRSLTSGILKLWNNCTCIKAKVKEIHHNVCSWKIVCSTPLRLRLCLSEKAGSANFPGLWIHHELHKIISYSWAQYEIVKLFLSYTLTETYPLREMNFHVLPIWP